MKGFISLAFFLFVGAFFCHAQLPYFQTQLSIQQPPSPKPICFEPDTVSVRIIGDVMMHQRQLSYEYGLFFRHISAPMKEADIAVANMEFTLAGEPYSGYPAFSSPDSYATIAVDSLGLDLILLANNHILDKGSVGLVRTISVYDTLCANRGTVYTGVSRDLGAESFIMLTSGVYRIAFVNFTYGTNVTSDSQFPEVFRMDRNRVFSAVRSARELGADFVVAMPHWGNEYELNHSHGQQMWAESLVEEGVDVIVGSHPHVVQDSTHISGVPVIYSVGNAVSNMSAKNTRLELMVTLRFSRNALTGVKYMLEPELRFMWCTLPGYLTEGYATIFVDEWLGRRDDWFQPSDYDEMCATLERVIKTNGITLDSTD